MKEPAAVWLTRFRDAGVPCAPINAYSQVLVDPQVDHMQWVQPLTLPNGATTSTFASPLRFDGQSATIRRAPPGLGEHNEEVLGALNLSPEEQV
jgi:crotonobetainyl-CoA:carnitine CoA-transferase CaiB-like acyl-CoA transferase